MLSRAQIDGIYQAAAKHGHSVVTADSIIETIDQIYRPDPQHRIDGKNIRNYLEQNGWTFCGEISKRVNGNDTTVGLYVSS